MPSFRGALVHADPSGGSGGGVDVTRKVARAYAPQPANHVQGCSVNSGCGLTGDAVESPVPIDAIGAWDGELESDE